MGIVIPTYNCADFVGRAVHSVRAQGFPHWCCVVVDDGSTEMDAQSALTAASGDSRVTVHRQSNRGVAAARNAGVSLLPGEITYLLFLDADDELHPGALAALVSALDGHPDAVAAFGGVQVIDELGTLLGPGRASCVTGDMPRTWSMAQLYVAAAIDCPGALLVRRRAFDDVMGFAAEPLEDFRLALDLAREGPIVQIAELVVSYRRHDRSETARLEGDGAVHLRRLRHAVYVDARNSPEQRRAVRTAWRHLHRLRAAELRRGGGTGRLARAAVHSVLALAPPVDLSTVARLRPGHRMRLRTSLTHRAAGLPPGDGMDSSLSPAVERPRK